MTVVRINEFQCADGKSEALSDFLKSLIPYISNSDGCLACEVLTQQDDKNRFIVLEKWKSVECHTKSIAQFPREQMEAVVPLLGAPPKGRYFSVS